jgi:hypothetical protein
MSQFQFNPLAYPKDRWACPKTGLIVCKSVNEWSSDRLRLIEWAEANPASAIVACRESFTFWINVFGWTYKVLQSGAGFRRATVGSLDRPFLTWPVQDKAAAEIINCIETGQDCTIKKSRDMGATWLILAIALHRCLFFPQTSVLIASRKEEEVDKGDPKKGANDPDTLFWKIDYMLSKLPDWMTGGADSINRTYMHIGFGTTDSVIDGESTNADLGRGGRRTFIMVDEAAAVANLRSVDAATTDSTSCRVFNSTPKGSSYFTKLCRSPHVRKVQLAWWDHPEKGQDRSVVKDERTGLLKVTSSWYEAECARRVDPRNIAENLDMDDTQSGWMFFDGPTIAKHTALYVRPPRMTGTLVNRLDLADAVLRWDSWVHQSPDKLLDVLEWRRDIKGAWKLWCTLEADADGILRPRQDHTYVFGIDVSAGLGASNSVISVFDRDLGEKVAEFADAYTSPERLAEIAALAGVWFGGPTGYAMLAWETNGPGGAFTKRIKSLAYPYLYRAVRTATRGNDSGDALGWTSNRPNKEYLLGGYRTALARGDFINRCAKAMEEASRYVYGESSGEILPGEMQEEEGNARATHGDRVIADAVAYEAALKAPRIKPPERPVPARSFLGRRQRRKAEKSMLNDDE